MFPVAQSFVAVAVMQGGHICLVVVFKNLQFASISFQELLRQTRAFMMFNSMSQL